MGQAWFEAKRFGYGAGLPIAWRGWALLGGYAALVAGAGVLLMPGRPLLYAGLAAGATAGVVAVAARRTRGGWRWRWGGDA